MLIGSKYFFNYIAQSNYYIIETTLLFLNNQMKIKRKFVRVSIDSRFSKYVYQIIIMKKHEIVDQRRCWMV